MENRLFRDYYDEMVIRTDRNKQSFESLMDDLRVYRDEISKLTLKSEQALGKIKENGELLLKLDKLSNLFVPKETVHKRKRVKNGRAIR